jgi:hypothetical protein
MAAAAIGSVLLASASACLGCGASDYRRPTLPPPEYEDTSEQALEPPSPSVAPAASAAFAAPAGVLSPSSPAASTSADAGRAQ